MGKRINVFISSTFSDLEPFRDAVTNVVLRLGLYPIIMEAFNPTDRNALQLCYDKVQEAEIFVGIYANRYGFVPPKDLSYIFSDGSKASSDGETGITHLEYLWAKNRQLPMLLFLLSDKDTTRNALGGSSVPIEDEASRQKLQAFKAMIMEEHVVGFFYSPDHLASQVATGLAEISTSSQTSKKLPDISSFSRHDFYKHIQIPPNYVLREDLLLSLRQKILTKKDSTNAGILALHGMGGIGKSVLARALCDHPSINEAFPDGILWATLGQSPNLTAILSEWIFALGDTISENVPSQDSLKAKLANLLEQKSCLLIIDDAWQKKHVEAISVPGSECCVLLTTRDTEIARGIGAEIESIPTMTTQEAIQLLKEWSGNNLTQVEDEILENIVNRLGKLPLALKLAGAQLQNKSPQEWYERFNARSLMIKRSDDIHDNLELTFNLSLDELDERQRKLYAALSIFREDEPIHELAIAQLWSGLNNLKEIEVEEFIDDLSSRALLQVLGNHYPRAAVLHDLLRDFMAAEVKTPNLIHQELLKAYEKTRAAEAWHTAPDDGYLYNHLVYHLSESENYEAIRSLFVSQDWLFARLRQSNFLYTAYIADLQIAINLARAKALSDNRYLIDLLRFCLIHTMINSLANQYPSSLIEAAVQTGLWSSEQAYQAAMRKTHMSEKRRTLFRLLKIDQIPQERLAIVLPILLEKYTYGENWSLTHQEAETIEYLLQISPEDLKRQLLDTLSDDHFSFTNDDDTSILLKAFLEIWKNKCLDTAVNAENLVAAISRISEWSENYHHETQFTQAELTWIYVQALPLEQKVSETKKIIRKLLQYGSDFRLIARLANLLLETDFIVLYRHMKTSKNYAAFLFQLAGLDLSETIQKTLAKDWLPFSSAKVKELNPELQLAICKVLINQNLIDKNDTAFLKGFLRENWAWFQMLAPDKQLEVCCEICELGRYEGEHGEEIYEIFVQHNAQVNRYTLRLMDNLDREQPLYKSLQQYFYKQALADPLDFIAINGCGRHLSIFELETYIEQAIQQYDVALIAILLINSNIGLEYQQKLVTKALISTVRSDLTGYVAKFCWKYIDDTGKAIALAFDNPGYYGTSLITLHNEGLISLLQHNSHPALIQDILRRIAASWDTMASYELLGSLRPYLNDTHTEKLLEIAFKHSDGREWNRIYNRFRIYASLADLWKDDQITVIVDDLVSHLALATEYEMTETLKALLQFRQRLSEGEWEPIFELIKTKIQGLYPSGTMQAWSDRELFALLFPICDADEQAKLKADLLRGFLQEDETHFNRPSYVQLYAQYASEEEILYLEKQIPSIRDLAHRIEIMEGLLACTYCSQGTQYLNDVINYTLADETRGVFYLQRIEEKCSPELKLMAYQRTKQYVQSLSLEELVKTPYSYLRFVENNGALLLSIKEQLMDEMLRCLNGSFAELTNCLIRYEEPQPLELIFNQEELRLVCEQIIEIADAGQWHKL